MPRVLTSWVRLLAYEGPVLTCEDRMLTDQWGRVLPCSLQRQSEAPMEMLRAGDRVAPRADKLESRADMRGSRADTRGSRAELTFEGHRLRR